jgi:hypothetical protein
MKKGLKKYSQLQIGKDIWVKLQTHIFKLNQKTE